MSEGQPLSPNLFKRNLAAGKRQIGLWLSLNSAMSTEICAGSGYDWLLLDMEHAAIDVSQVLDHLRAAKGGTAELMVRLPWNDPIIMKRLLDAGVRNFMIPMVQSAAEARLAVEASRYPPRGFRGVAGNIRAANFNRITSYVEHCHEEQCIVVQIETPKGVEAIEEIGAIDGVDGLFIGPNDLSANMGLLGKMGAPEAKKMIAHALDKIRKTGKAPGILNFVPAEARALLAAGFTFIAVGADGSIVARRSEALLAEITSAS
jgi:4-hydroxy-2-oxoheptanedioate aldolase